MSARVTVLVLALLVPAWGALVEDAEADAGPAEPTVEEAAVSSRVEHIMRVEDALESDRRKLQSLQADLKARDASFEALTLELETSMAARDAARARLEAAGEGADPAIAEELEWLDQVYTQLDKRSGLAFEARKTIAEQIVALEAKIVRDQAALAELKGVPREPAPAIPEPVAPPPATEAPTSTALPLPTAVPLPPRAPAPSARTQTADQTPEQIEARLEAEEKEKDARQAARAVAEFISRKAALEEQIKLEQKLLGTADETQQGVLEQLRSAQEQLEREIERGASREVLQQAQQEVREVGAELAVLRAEIDGRNATLAGLRERLRLAEQDQLRFTRAAAETREDATAARDHTIWLESPLHPQNLRAWAIERVPRVAAVLAAIVGALLLVRAVSRSIAGAVTRSGVGSRPGRLNRANTLASAFRGAANVLIVVAGGLLALQEAGVDVTTLLGGAAILGVALAFGAQNLMRDYFNGFMIMLEDQYELDDLLTIGTITGRVERVNMRTTVLRDLEGRLHFIPNGEITTVTNRTYEWAQPVFDIRVAYKENVDRVMAVLLEVAEDMRRDPEWGESIVDEPMMLGVDRFEESGVIIKFMLKTKPDKLFPIRRETLRRIKNRFDELGIEIPVPHRVVLHGKARDSDAHDEAFERRGPKAIRPEGR